MVSVLATAQAPVLERYRALCGLSCISMEGKKNEAQADAFI